MRSCTHDLYVNPACVKGNLHFRNEFNFWNVHGIMNTSGLFARHLEYS